MSFASGRRPRRAKGKSMMSGSQNRLKRKGSIAWRESGPPSWKSTTPIRRLSSAIVNNSRERTDECKEWRASSSNVSGKLSGAGGGRHLLHRFDHGVGESAGGSFAAYALGELVF